MSISLSTASFVPAKEPSLPPQRQRGLLPLHPAHQSLQLQVAPQGLEQPHIYTAKHLHEPIRHRVPKPPSQSPQRGSFGQKTVCIQGRGPKGESKGGSRWGHDREPSARPEHSVLGHCHQLEEPLPQPGECPLPGTGHQAEDHRMGVSPGAVPQAERGCGQEGCWGEVGQWELPQRADLSLQREDFWLQRAQKNEPNVFRVLLPGNGGGGTAGFLPSVRKEARQERASCCCFPQGPREERVLCRAQQNTEDRAGTERAAGQRPPPVTK